VAIYDYACTSCGHVTEVVHAIHDAHYRRIHRDEGGVERERGLAAPHQEYELAGARLL
jgi:predicted nucleic acid-binding Zn ribbon protein